ncbi:MAG: carboxypeptidase-like regulatory domain-containing protein [bacterium]
MTTRRLRLACAVGLALGIAGTGAAQGVVRGVVADSIHRGPLRGATIVATPASELRDTIFHSAISDSRGRFELNGLRAGRYSLSVEHPLIDSTAIGVPTVSVTVSRGDTSVVALAIPSAATLRRGLCSWASRDRFGGGVIGRGP